MSVAYQVVHRRNNAAPALALIVTSLLILLSAFLPIAQITGPNVSVTAAAVGLNLTPHGSYDPDPIGLWFWTAGFVFAFGVTLLATRVRGLGILWRILAVIPILIMGTYAGIAWYVVSNPEKALLAEGNGSIGEVAAGAATAAKDIGLYDVYAGVGLVLLSAAVMIGVVAIFLPARKSQRYIPIPITGPLPGYPPTQAAQQQYPLHDPYTQQPYNQQPYNPRDYPTA